VHWCARACVCAAERRQRHEKTKSNERVRTHCALVPGAVARLVESLTAGAALVGLLAGLLRGGGRDTKGRGERRSAASRTSACALTVRSCSVQALESLNRLSCSCPVDTAVVYVAACMSTIIYNCAHTRCDNNNLECARTVCKNDELNSSKEPCPQ
jgi:hypothetical protein